LYALYYEICVNPRSAKRKVSRTLGGMREFSLELVLMWIRVRLKVKGYRYSLFPVKLWKN